MKKIHPHSGPIQVPHIVLEVLADGTPAAEANDAPLDPLPSPGPWRRSSNAQIIDLAAGGRSTPALIEVRKCDSTAFTDVIATASRRRAQEPAAAVEDAIGTADPPAFAEIEETGFVPAEDVAVAVILGHTEAGPEGTARALIDSARLRAAEVVLLGRTSGTLAIRRLP